MFNRNASDILGQFGGNYRPDFGHTEQINYGGEGNLYSFVSTHLNKNEVAKNAIKYLHA